MAHKTVNIGKVYARLEDFWNTNKYTDVTIICESKHFKCHRLILAAACDYFDAMFFGGRFRDSISEDISLPEMTAEVFEQVLQFIYTGDAQIDSENVFSVLQASEFLGLPGLEDLCVSSLIANGANVRDTLSIFMYACATGKKLVADFLCLHIVNHFAIFSKVDSFLEIPLDDLKRILSCYTRSSMRNEEALLTCITRWIHHKQEERLHYLQEFARMICFENISSTYMQHMFTKLMLGAHCPALMQTCKPVGDREDSVLLVSAPSQVETLLHVFVKHTKEENLLKVYSINSAQVCSVSEDPIILKHSSQWVHNVALDNFHLYRLYSTTPDYKSRQENSSSFYSFASVSNSVGLRLKDPPVNFYRHVGFCAIKNNIYTRYQETCCAVNLKTSFNFLNEEEINRGICAYNCEVDDWFPVPEMKRRMIGGAITSLDNILYLVGGLRHGGFDLGYAQMYDCREGKWQELPLSHSVNFYIVDGCSMNGKIYIYSGLSERSQLERFDPVAGRWEEMVAHPLQKITGCEHMVPYLDKLYVMGGFTSSTSRQLAPLMDLSINTFDVKSCTWKKCSVLTEMNSSGPGTIVDVVVSRP